MFCQKFFQHCIFSGRTTYIISCCHILASLEWVPMCLCNSSSPLNDFSQHCSQSSNGSSNGSRNGSSNGIFMWIFWWVSRSSWSEKVSLQSLHRYWTSLLCCFSCSFLCIDDIVKTLSHISQRKVLPFVWSLWCFLNSFVFENNLLQWLQGKTMASSVNPRWSVIMWLISSLAPANLFWQWLQE